MCSQYIIDKSGEWLTPFYKAREIKPLKNGERIVPRRPAPILFMEKGRRVLTEMEFGLIPAWSKTRKVKFATHNARLMSEDEKFHKEIPIYKKPTWREPFAKRHCIVPISKFIEPLYTGRLAGTMVRFFPKGGQMLSAAGIWEEWASKETGEVVLSFTVLTDDPVPYISKMGHDRTPVFLKEERIDEWLDAGSKKSEDWLPFLRGNVDKIEWTEEIDRPLAKNWEQRKPD